MGSKKRKKRASRPRYKGITKPKKVKRTTARLAPAMKRLPEEPNLFMGTAHVKVWGELRRCPNTNCPIGVYPGERCSCSTKTVPLEGPPIVT